MAALSKEIEQINTRHVHKTDSTPSIFQPLPPSPSKRNRSNRASGYRHPELYMMLRLTDNEGLILREVVLGNLEVQRGGALADTARDVVVRTVAGAEPAAVVAGLADGHTTQVGADTQHDQPLGALDTVVVGLGVTERLPLGLAGLGDLVLGTVADEDGLATPLDDDLFRGVLGG